MLLFKCDLYRYAAFLRRVQEMQKNQMAQPPKTETLVAVGLDITFHFPLLCSRNTFNACVWKYKGFLLI